jgi:hypothetical protein
LSPLFRADSDVIRSVKHRVYICRRCFIMLTIYIKDGYKKRQKENVIAYAFNKYSEIHKRLKVDLTIGLTFCVLVGLTLTIKHLKNAHSICMYE